MYFVFFLTFARLFVPWAITGDNLFSTKSLVLDVCLVSLSFIEAALFTPVDCIFGCDSAVFVTWGVLVKIFPIPEFELLCCGTNPFTWVSCHSANFLEQAL